MMKQVKSEICSKSEFLSIIVDLWPYWSFLLALDNLFTFSIYFCDGLYSQIEVFLRNKWYKASNEFTNFSEFSGFHEYI